MTSSYYQTPTPRPDDLAQDRWAGAPGGAQAGWPASAGSGGRVPPGPAAPSSLGSWLDQQEQHLVHPKLVEESLRRAGWWPQHAAIEGARYRARFNEHPLGYATLLVSTGAAALSLGTVGHELAAGLNGPVSRNFLGVWLTLFLVSGAFLVPGLLWALRVDRNDPVAVWSNSRRSLSQALVWGCGIVGLARLFWYGAQLVGLLVGATWAHQSLAAGLANVAVTVGIALPVGWGAFWFGHRFDSVDPTLSEAQRRRLAG
ncbi:MAG: hypothetical protein ACRDZ8_05335 [Acidimicrobiales bacterium]